MLLPLQEAQAEQQNRGCVCGRKYFAHAAEGENRQVLVFSESTAKSSVSLLDSEIQPGGSREQSHPLAVRVGSAPTGASGE
jgi:hypothetical protein